MGTGLKDIKGNEILNGDLLIDDEGVTWKVFETRGSWRAKFIGKDASMSLSDLCWLAAVTKVRVAA